WLMVTAEPDFAVQAPSPAVVLVSRSQEETRTSNKAATLESPLIYFTPYTGYDSQPAAQPITGVAPQFQQARKALQLAARATESFQDAGDDATLAEEARALALLRYAQNMLQGGETESRNGNWPLAIQWARTSTQLAEAARALATGITGALPARRLRRELTQLRSENARTQGELAETERRLTSLNDRGTQLEAELDAERRRTRELEGQLLALRERISVLEELFGTTRQRNAFLEEERSKVCTELRQQLDSVGKLTEQAGHLVLTLSSDILFEFNRFNLRPGARENLAKLAVVRRLLFADVPVRFEGHTDLTGEENYNQWLSEQRALAVYRYFLEAQAADTTDEALRTPLDQRLAVVRRLLDMSFNASRRDAGGRREMLALLGEAVAGKGMREPVVPEQGRNEQNRRVTLVFPEATAATPSPLCASAPAGTSSRLSQ
ncbi:MAG: OmpA family protein, partial [Terriglobia bacterium]